MLSKKTVDKAKVDLTRLKDIVSQLQINVTEHTVKINSKLVSEDELRLSMDMMDDKFQARLDNSTNILREQLIIKFRDYLMIEDLESPLRDKVDSRLFMKYIDRINQQISVQENATEVKLPAIEMKLINLITQKADQRFVDEELDKKEDRSFTEAMNARLITMEESVEKLN